jgi:DNA modification methylase
MHPIQKLLAPARQERCRILVGDNRELLRTLPAKSIQTCVTSPPYFGLRDYGVEGQLGLEATPDEFCAALVEVFQEVRRVLKDDGTVWLNLGDSYCNAGSRNNGSGLDGKRRGGMEGSDGTWEDSRNKYGDMRKGFPSIGVKHKDLIGIPWRVAFALQADGWYLRQDIIWHKPNPMPESVRDRCTKAHEYIFLLTKKPKYYFDSSSMQEPASQPDRKRNDRFGGNKYVEGVKHSDRSQFTGAETRNRRSVWTVTTKPYKGAHFATFPPDLIRPCILAGSRPGDTVLDPFGGSGTTGQVALEEGRRAVLTELNPAYADLARERISKISR